MGVDRRSRDGARPRKLPPLCLDAHAVDMKRWGSEHRLAAEVLQTVAAMNADVTIDVPAESAAAWFVDETTCNIPRLIAKLDDVCSKSWPNILYILDRVTRRAGLPFHPRTACRLIAAAVGLVCSCEDSNAIDFIASAAGVPRRSLAQMNEIFYSWLASASGGVVGGEGAWDELLGYHELGLLRGELKRVARDVQRLYATRQARGKGMMTSEQPRGVFGMGGGTFSDKQWTFPVDESHAGHPRVVSPDLPTELVSPMTPRTSPGVGSTGSAAANAPVPVMLSSAMDSHLISARSRSGSMMTSDSATPSRSLRSLSITSAASLHIISPRAVAVPPQQLTPQSVARRASTLLRRRRLSDAPSLQLTTGGAGTAHPPAEPDAGGSPSATSATGEKHAAGAGRFAVSPLSAVSSGPETASADVYKGIGGTSPLSM